MTASIKARYGFRLYNKFIEGATIYELILQYVEEHSIIKAENRF